MQIRILPLSLVAFLVLSSCSGNPDTGSDTDTTTATTSTEATISGSQVDYTIKYDTSKWLMTESDPTTSDFEYEFEHVDGDVYGMIIPERVEMTEEALKEIVLSNAQSVAPDATITLEETRTVNGVDMLVIKIGATIYGMAFEYYGYYYVGNAGTIQFLTYTTTNLADDYEADITELLNGLTVTE